MVKNTYGKTPWGLAFLDALSCLDYDKRMDRGKSYANTGKVRHMVIEDPCRVRASVVGSEVYRVEVTFTPLGPEDKVVICHTIEDNMLVLGKILFGELPGELLELLDKAGISLMPLSWNEISARCSCPDYANPCKHMAAVYFHLTTHIDQDPFTLFRLRGLNLLSHFSIREGDADPGYPLATDTFNESQDPSNQDQLCEDNNKPSCSLSSLPDMTSFILDCLKSNPPYCLQLDYKEVMSEFYSRIKKKGSQILEEMCAKRDSHWASGLDLEAVHRVLSNCHIIMPLDRKFDNHHLLLHNDLFDVPNSDSLSVFGAMPHIVETIPVEDNLETVEQCWLKVDLLTAMQLFLLLGSDFGSPSYVWFHCAFRFLVSIINSNAFIPEVLPTLLMPTNSRVISFKVIWKPLYTCEKVAAQLTKLNQIFPVGYNVVNLDNEPLAAQPSALHFLTASLTRFVLNTNFMHKKCNKNPPKESLSFFKGQTYIRNNLNEDKVAKSIAKEFSVFDLLKLDFGITVSVNELDMPDITTGAEYSLSIRLRGKTDEGHGEVIRDFLEKHPALKPQVLKLLATLHPYLPQLVNLLTSPLVSLSHVQLEQFVLDSALVLANLGINVIMPKELRDLLKPDSVLLASAVEDLEKFPDKYRTFMSLGDLLKFDWKVCLGDEMVDFAEFEKLVASGRKLVRYKDKFVSVSPEEMKKLLAAKRKKNAKHNSFEILKEALTENTLMRFTSDVNTFIKGLVRITNHKVPVNLHATLREYQLTGFRWMLSNLLNGFGVVLADDMGLGKTIQTIAVLLHLKNSGQLQHSALIVVPASVLSNWEREIKRFAPSLSVVRHYGAHRQATSGMQSLASEDLLQEAVVTTDDKKDLKMKSYLDQALEKATPSAGSQLNYDDEAASLPAKYGYDEEDDMEKMPLTTFIRPCIKKEPVTSHLAIKEEPKTHLSEDNETKDDPRIPSSFCLQDVTNSQPEKKKKRGAKKRRNDDVDGGQAKKRKSADILLTTFQTALKDADLLAKQDFDICVVDEAQRIKNAQSQTSKALKRIKAPMRIALSGTPVENKLLELWSIFDFILPKYLGAPKEFGDTFAKPIEIRRDETKAESLKKVTAPFMLRRLKTDRDVIKDLPDKIVENMYCSLTTQQAALYESKVQDVDCKLMAMESKKQRNMFIFELMLRLKQICNHPSNLDSNFPRDVQTSGKMKMLVELLENILSSGEKVLIFTQFVQMIKIMADIITKRFQLVPLIYHGELSEKKKDDAVQAFMTQPHSQVFIVSTRAGGVGLNLTAANHVVHYDLWYNPAVENQATDRAFRIGQKKNVFVYRFITENTFEEKIEQMIIAKRELSEMTVGTKEQWIGNLTDQGIKDLFVRS